MNSIIRTNGLGNLGDSLLTSMVPNWDDFFPQVVRSNAVSPASRVPAVDIRETDSELKLIADLPGIDKEAIEVSVKEGILSLTVKSEQEHSEESQGRVIRQERYRGTFLRSFKLNDTVDDENIQASYKDGVLSITVPKKEPVKPKRIEVAVH